MDLDKLIKKLKSNLDKGKKNKHDISCERIDELLDKIKKKQRKLKSMLAEEDDKTERKHIKLELKIASVEIRKGLKRRKEIEKDSK